MGDPIHDEKIRREVCEYYAKWGREGLGSEACCDPASSDSACCESYPAGLLEKIPASADVLSLGCGDPISAAALQPGETVLDLGSGGGLDCLLAANQVDPGGRVIGVDMTEEMLSRARANTERSGLGNVEFRKGVIESLPVEDQAVDVVISNCVINLSPDKPAVLREIARVLRPSGRLAVADIVTRGPLLQELRTMKDSWAACIAGALTADEYEDGLRRAGFVDIRLRPVNGRPLEEVQEGFPFSALITARKA